MLVWETICNAPSSSLTARYRLNQQKSIRTAPSQLVCTLRDTAWIPDRKKRFHKPCDIRREDLPTGFVCDDRNGWLTEIGFESKRKQESAAVQEKRKIAASLGIPAEFVELLEQLPKEARKEALGQYVNDLRQRKDWTKKAASDTSEFKRLSDNEKRKPKRPDAKSSNPAHREERVAEQAANADFVERMKRERQVRVNWDTVREAREYLRAKQTNEGDQMVCQICGDEMPFKLPDGTYYFEAVECVKGLSRELPQNYIALCPVCAAKYRHANATQPAELKERILKATGSEVPVILAREACYIVFTGVHLLDLQTALRTVEDV